MQNAPVIASELSCDHCGWLLIKNGEMKCKRSGHTVQATLGQKEIFCPYCRKPRVLLLDEKDQAVCPRCDNRTLINSRECARRHDMHEYVVYFYKKPGKLTKGNRSVKIRSSVAIRTGEIICFKQAMPPTKDGDGQKGFRWPQPTGVWRWRVFDVEPVISEELSVDRLLLHVKPA